MTLAAILSFAAKLMPLIAAIFACLGERAENKKAIIKAAEEDIREGIENKELSKEDRASRINAGFGGIGRV